MTSPAAGDAGTEPVRVRTAVQVAYAGVTGLLFVVAFAMNDASDWDPAWLVVVLMAGAAIAEITTVRVGPLRFATAEIPLLLALALCGPLPAAACAVVALVTDAVWSRPRSDLMLLNGMTYLTYVMAGAGVLEGASALDLAEQGSAGFPLVVLFVGLLQNEINFALVALLSPLGRWLSWREKRQRLWRPLFPFALLGSSLVAAAAHAAVTLGPHVVLVVAVILIAIQQLLRANERAAERALQLEGEVAQRELELARAVRAEHEALTLALHDDALQSVLVARQDVREARQGDAGKLDRSLVALDSAIQHMRALLVQRLADDPGDQLRQRLDAVAQDARSRGLEVSIEVEDITQSPDVALLLETARELVRNAVQHSHGNRVQIRVAESEGVTWLEVSDNGRGLLERPPPEAGHVGLELIRRRVMRGGGTVEVSPARGGGLVVSVTLPNPTQDPGARAVRAADAVAGTGASPAPPGTT